ncbi:uncharacterized protein LOC110603118 isoform X6 [Manihot esculenta]|uniref:uncharacterized protein LOC110603118 isoform X6 n=1 Tax=Manihot esculenta TaxID=3983 RepID=UPI000B5D255C|nr:uncharacterized protein LOC110603118 isoform X6 [Manihot esculenta]
MQNARCSTCFRCHSIVSLSEPAVAESSTSSTKPECNNLLSVYQLISRKTRAYVDRVLEGGTTKAAELADATLNNVYLAMGFLRRL